MGRELARLHPVEADVVIPVPDSGIYAALGFAEELGIPYDPAFVRNHYIGRTFIQPNQLIRDFNVRVKLNLIGDAVKGKRVVVVDDSVVRGTTAKARVVNLREAGAKEVHFRVSCPPHMNPCVYGIDFPDRNRLSEAYLNSALLTGIPRNDDYNGAEQEGAGYYQTTIKNGLRMSAAKAFLRPAMKRPNLRVIPHALAERVLDGIEAQRRLAIAHLFPGGRLQRSHRDPRRQKSGNDKQTGAR
jgi:choline dehydrogenase-like flavoprotein